MTKKKRSPRLAVAHRVNKPVNKTEERRAELATAALQTLSELGYARTSLREIAQNSAFSHGVLHYYFHDKVDLIMYCVKQYKAVCVQRYNEIVASAKTADELRSGFAAGMMQTLRDDATMHRLWYDLRGQSLFEASFRKDVGEIDASLERMIWRIVSQYSHLGDGELLVSSPLAYAMFDGIFQHALRRFLNGDKKALTELGAHVERLLGELVLSKRAKRRAA